LIDRLTHSAEGYRLGANIQIHHRWQLEDLHGDRSYLDLCVADGHVLVGRHLIGHVGLVVGVEAGVPTIGHIRFHSTCRAEVTLARCRLLSACRTSEVPNGSSLKSPIASTGVCTVTPLVNLIDAEPILPPIAPV
jgi:hypothetical protein